MPEHDRALVVIGFTEPDRRLLRHAGRQAQGCDMELVLLTIMPNKEFQERDQARLAIPRLEMPYTVGAAQDEGRQHARRLARDILASFDISYEIESRIGRKASLILDRAVANRCSQVFLAGHRNSPWQNDTFDQVMTEVVTEFDGPVTVIVDPEHAA